MSCGTSPDASHRRAVTASALGVVGYQLRQMKHRIIVILGLAFLIACTYRPKEKRLAKDMGHGSQIIESFYRRTNDTIDFKRIPSNATELKIQSGQIFFYNYALTSQKLEPIEPNRVWRPFASVR